MLTAEEADALARHLIDNGRVQNNAGRRAAAQHMDLGTARVLVQAVGKAEALGLARSTGNSFVIHKPWAQALRSYARTEGREQTESGVVERMVATGMLTQRHAQLLKQHVAQAGGSISTFALTKLAPENRAELEDALRAATRLRLVQPVQNAHALRRPWAKHFANYAPHPNTRPTPIRPAGQSPKPRPSRRGPAPKPRR